MLFHLVSLAYLACFAYMHFRRFLSVFVPVFSAVLFIFGLFGRVFFKIFFKIPKKFLRFFSRLTIKKSSHSAFVNQPLTKAFLSSLDSILYIWYNLYK